MQMQHGICFMILAFLFLTPEIANSMTPDADQRKKAMVASVCDRLKSQIEDWDCQKMGEGSPFEAILARAKLQPVPSSAEWSKEASLVIPAKYLQGRDPVHYVRFKAAKTVQEGVPPSSKRID